MLDNFVIAINISAKSMGKNESGEREECAKFVSSINIDGSWNASKSINPDLYDRNKAEARSDFSKFEESIEGFSRDISPAVSALVEKFKKELEQELAKK